MVFSKFAKNNAFSGDVENLVDENNFIVDFPLVVVDEKHEKIMDELSKYFSSVCLRITRHVLEVDVK